MISATTDLELRFCLWVMEGGGRGRLGRNGVERDRGLEEFTVRENMAEDTVEKCEE